MRRELRAEVEAELARRAETTERGDECRNPKTDLPSAA